MTLESSLRAVTDADVEQLIRKEAEYGSSWKKRGGVGAFMMVARKWDRLEVSVTGKGYDVFAAAENDPREEGVLDDIGDLRRYLLLIEAHIRDCMAAKAKPDYPDPGPALRRAACRSTTLANRDEWSSRPGPDDDDVMPHPGH
jgi:hypothetical protein